MTTDGEKYYDGQRDWCRKHELMERWCAKHEEWEFYCPHCGKWHIHQNLYEDHHFNQFLQGWKCRICHNVVTGKTS